VRIDCGSHGRLLIDRLSFAESMSHSERSILVECLYEVSYAEGATVINQGEPGVNFYLVEEVLPAALPARSHAACVLLPRLWFASSKSPNIVTLFCVCARALARVGLERCRRLLRCRELSKRLRVLALVPTQRQSSMHAATISASSR
jgi:hypothetical protein